MSKTAASQPYEAIRFVFHESFTQRTDARALEAGEVDVMSEREFSLGHLPDDLTRTCARQMHYAAYRAHKARTPQETARWRTRYFALRDRIVLGNRKLIFGAVRRKLYQSQHSEDLIGECYIIMIKAVAAYNPWLGIRFSTYAYTCLMRALSRLNKRTLADRLSQHLSLDSILGAEPALAPAEPASSPAAPKVDEFLRDEHPLLSSREKTVLRRRFQLGNPTQDRTLEKVGHDLGISKERVRQVQATALSKLRQVLVGEGALA